MIFTVSNKRPSRFCLYHVEINQYGLVWYKQGFWEELVEGEQHSINISSVLGNLLLTVNFAKKFYEKLGYWGLIEVNLNLEGIKGKPLGIYYGSYKHVESFSGASLDESFYISRKKSIMEIRENSDKVVL